MHSHAVEHREVGVIHSGFVGQPLHVHTQSASDGTLHYLCSNCNATCGEKGGDEATAFPDTAVLLVEPQPMLWAPELILSKPACFINASVPLCGT